MRHNSPGAATASVICQARGMLVLPLAFCIASCTIVGCTSYQYEYVLNVSCKGRHVPNEPSYVTDVGHTPPVDVTIKCDTKTIRASFDPMGQTKTLRFGDRPHVMINYVRGFTVRIERPGYKPWAAEYLGEQHLMQTESHMLIRLDSVQLEPLESPHPSVRVKGGPDVGEGR